MIQLVLKLEGQDKIEQSTGCNNLGVKMLLWDKFSSTITMLVGGFYMASSPTYSP